MMSRLKTVLQVIAGLIVAAKITLGVFLVCSLAFTKPYERHERVETTYGVPVYYSQGVTLAEAQAVSICFRKNQWVAEHSRLQIDLKRVNGRVVVTVGEHTRIDGRPVRFWNDKDQLEMGETLSQVAFNGEPLTMTFQASKNASGGTLQIECKR
jgi:hypothetical protein